MFFCLNSALTKTDSLDQLSSLIGEGKVLKPLRPLFFGAETIARKEKKEVCVQSLEEKSLQHFGSSEHKVLPRNKSFIEILFISGKIPAVDEK